MARQGFKSSHVLLKFFSFIVKKLKSTLSAASEDDDSPQILFLHSAPV